MPCFVLQITFIIFLHLFNQSHLFNDLEKLDVPLFLQGTHKQSGRLRLVMLLLPKLRSILTLRSQFPSLLTFIGLSSE